MADSKICSKLKVGRVDTLKGLPLLKPVRPSDSRPERWVSQLVELHKRLRRRRQGLRPFPKP